MNHQFAVCDDYILTLVRRLTVVEEIIAILLLILIFFDVAITFGRGFYSD